MNRNQFKILLLLVMVLDHASFIFPASYGIGIHIISRFVAVGFAYLAVEGFRYTSDVKRYIMRMYLVAIVMFVGNKALGALGIYSENNILLTLGIGLTALWAIRAIKQPILKILAVSALLALGVLLAEGGMVVIPFMLLTYLFRESKIKQYISYLLLSSLLLLFSVMDMPSSMTLTEIMMLNADFMFITVIPLLECYNHRLEKKTAFNQSFFYVFYPLHLWSLAIIQSYVILG
ncbi:TraX family protein [Streptococcus catagoni]|uniref:TraX family protein n=1 Tax=Streptococcus catagoni TaxID=2654874 RepID=UPI0014089217|nr:TraX family protein [Streptococcus catagoni]